ncbi:hypothetical protein [Novosphingobium humi]|uniref:Uncharacterized protein n=1 Tax=Novosphingobium humi TaxID=2282397 RepID=A0ABY7TZC7_9SPHN|nr:hypothetical protein [Novosphingobium humi]WCT78633.1 hypothetical protein PQ457_06635 [Novosphingobium humi]
MKRAFLARIAARFARKAPSPRTEPPVLPPDDSPEDWGVNDMAECIAPYGDWTCRRTGLVLEGGEPQFGETYRVVQVDTMDATTGLVFAPWPRCAFNAVAFRKVTPRADEQTAGTCATLRDLLRLPAKPLEVA